MKIALATQTPEVDRPAVVSLLSGTFEERAAKASEWGADGLELLPFHPAALDAQAVRETLQRHGLEAAAIGSVLLGFGGITLLDAEAEKARRAEARLHELIDFAAATGASLVGIGGHRGRIASIGSEQGPARLVSILREAAVYASARNVRIAIEPINHYQTDYITNVDEGLAVLDKIDHPAAGLLLDTCHMNIEESSWSGAFERAMAAGRLWHVHVADNNRLAPGHGLIDFQVVVAALRDAGYSGYLSAEVFAQPDADSAARASLATMGRILNQAASEPRGS
jgi:sugar phosphate isomerase/epimerase